MDIAIIGGGPAGLYLANLLKNGFDIKVFEEHREIGYPVHCTGLVTKDVMEFVSKNVVLNKIKGAHIHVQNEKITIEKRDFAAFVIDRPLFDRYIYENVSENVLLGERVKEIKRNGNNYSIKAKNEYESRVVVGADGPRSILRSMVYNKNIPLLNGIQYSIKNDDYLGEYVHIFLDRKFSKGFFSWIVPREDDVLVGLATYDNIPMQRMKSFLNHVSLSNKVVEKIAGQIPIGTLPDHEKKNVFLTGDAALFIKATSGGGLYYGLTGSKMLAKSIIENSSYEKNLMEMLKELKMDYYIHKIFSKMEDKELIKIMSRIREKSVIEIINKYGDIDRPYVASRKLLIKKEIIPLYPLLFSLFIKSIIS